MKAPEKTLQTQIDENLKRIFDEDARAELPDRLLTLLERLDEVEVPPPHAGTSKPGDRDDGGTA